MKKISVSCFEVGKEYRRGFKGGSVKKLAVKLRKLLSLQNEIEDLVEMPPPAPHNTNDYIIDGKQEILYNEEDLLGSLLIC